VSPCGISIATFLITGGISEGATKKARKAGSADQDVDETGRTAGSARACARRNSIVVATAGVRRFWQVGNSLSLGLVSVIAFSTPHCTNSSDTHRTGPVGS
jgi:hypothetical protein